MPPQRTAVTREKPMRLGTKSCSECRRRKVRCIFAEDSAKCRQCTLHSAVCKPQTSQERSHRDSELAVGHDTAIRALLLALARRQPLPLDTISSIPSSPDGKTSSVPLRYTDGGISTDPPLLHFLRSALAAQPLPTPQPSRPTNVGLRTTLSDPIQFWIPEPETLNSILQATQPFWSVWPLASFCEGGGGHGFPFNISEASSFVDQHLQSSSAGRIAKCLAWLTLCLQQFPKCLHQEISNSLPLPVCELIELYLDEVDILTRDHSEPGSIECLEALAVQFKCLVNMARPQRAWKCARNGIDNAMLLGLYRNQGDDVLFQRGKEVLAYLQRDELQMAVFLGLPHSTPDSPKCSHGDILSLPLGERLQRQLSLIFSRIIERDQAAEQASYSMTARITEEIEALHGVIPAEWWQPTEMDLATPLGTTFWNRAAVFFYHYVNQLLHLPYVLKAKENGKYRYNRDMALASAEGMLVTFPTFPVSDGLPVMCDYLDFSAFSGAIILAADLVASQPERPAWEEQRLWGLIMRFAADMRQKAAVLECSVAGQAAELLKYLHGARHGTYNGPEEYDVVVPYFGRISIKRPACQAQPALEQTSVEFVSHAFEFRLPDELDTMFELGEDWSMGSFVESSSDWTASFSFS